MKAWLRARLGEWQLYWILTLPESSEGAPDPRVRLIVSSDRSELLGNPTAKLRAAVRYMDGGCSGLVLVQDGRIAAVCHLSGRDRAWDGTIWPLEENALGVVNVVTDERARARGHAAALLREAVRRHSGTPLLAHVWWNNKPSLRAFRKAGARRTGFMAGLFGRTLRLRRPFALRHLSGSGTRRRP